MTECANCRTVTECHDDGEAYVCVDTAACRLRQVYDLYEQVSIFRECLELANHAADVLKEQRDEARQERDALRAQIKLLRSTLQLARGLLSETNHLIGIGYDWNADPGYVTLKQGEVFRAIDAALAVTNGPEGEIT